MRAFMALVAGLVFGIGLIVSGMTDPSKVLAFLDLAGAWDPSLAMVMVGGIAVGTFAFALAAKRTRTLLGEVMRLPTTTQIDGRLVLGGVLFGIGWGLGGYCPGPVLAALLTGGVKPLVFIIALLAGMATFEFVEQQRLRVSVAARLLRLLKFKRSPSRQCRR
jgi:uncharacterized membrane protein YedE/YeeE